MNSRPIDKLFEALSYMAPRPKPDKILALINQISDVDIVMEIEKIKVSNRANLPSLGLFAAKAIIDNNLSRDSLNADSINMLNTFESENMRKRFIGIGHS